MISSLLGLFRRFAQKLRHCAGLRILEPLWNVLRPPYRWLMRAATARRGLTVTVGGHRLKLHPLFADMSWESVEPESYSAFVKMIRQGDAIYDVGASLGTYTMIAAQHIGPSGRVIAYEPHNVTRSFLERHLKWNGVSGLVTVRDVCLGAAAGSTDFYYGAGQEAVEGMNGRLAVDGFAKKQVLMATLDEEAARLQRPPRLIKIDVEGGEWDVLRGAERTLEEVRPPLLLSLHPQALAKIGVTSDDILNWLKDRRYRTEVLARDHEVHVLAQPL